MPERTVVCVPAERAGLRADAFLALVFPAVSRTRLRQKVMRGEALLNGRRFATSARLREGDEITLAWRGAVPAAPGSATPSLPVLFEDGELLAVDKPAGMDSHPMGAVQSGTLIQIAQALLRGETERLLALGDRERTPVLANRLDRFSSGVVLVAKSRAALAAMQALRARGGIEKRYIVLVEGRLPDDAGTIDLPLGPDPRSRVGVRMAPQADGRTCSTEYRVIRRFSCHTLVRAFSRTGRQHQVRAHFAAIGHPVWGDLVYRDESLFLRYRQNGGRLDPSLPPRHLLHAEAVAFEHPVTGHPVEIVSPLPPDFTAILRRLARVRRLPATRRSHYPLNMENRSLAFGVASLAASLAGVAAGTASLVLARLGIFLEPRLSLVIGIAIFLALELFALVVGIATRRTQPGASGLTVSAVALVLFAAAFAYLYPAIVVRG